MFCFYFDGHSLHPNVLKISKTFGLDDGDKMTILNTDAHVDDGGDDDGNR